MSTPGVRPSEPKEPFTFTPQSAQTYLTEGVAQEKLKTTTQRSHFLKRIYEAGHVVFRNLSMPKEGMGTIPLIDRKNVAELNKDLETAFEKEVRSSRNPITAFFAKNFGWGLDNQETDVYNLIKGYKKIEKGLEEK